MAENRGILDGVKVLSSVAVVAGPFATALMAENGAEVINIEHPTIMDSGKNWGHLYCMEHRNEKSISLNVKEEAAQEVIRKLIAKVDIFVEASRPGVWDRLGFSDEVLWKINPKLVIAHISGYGQTGDPEYVLKPAYDMIGQAFGGLISLMGMPDPNSPMYAKPYTCDYVTGFATAFGCVAALLKARETGKGESIDCAMFEVAARLQAGYPVDGFMQGTQPRRTGNQDAVCATDCIYKTKDEKWVVIAVARPNDAWIKVIGLSDDPDFVPAPFITWSDPRSEKYVAAFREFATTHTLEEILNICEKANQAAIPVMEYQDMKTNSHYLARNTIINWYDPLTNKELTGITSIPRFKNNPGGIYRGAPRLGMDNDGVLTSLGYSPNEIAKMRETGVLGGE